MTPLIVAITIGLYFILLIVVSRVTSKGANSSTFFNANRESPWYLVAFGMIGASLSGVTFISVPGQVGSIGWGYLQFVLGNFVGIIVISKILLPLYYKMNLVSIYSYLDTRFGKSAYRAGAVLFLISKIIGAAFRLFLVAGVLQLAFFDAFGIPFYITVTASIVLIWIYTRKGGIKTIVWTDTLQTLFLLLAVILTIITISSKLDWTLSTMVEDIYNHPYSKFLNLDYKSAHFFPKQFIAGIFITIVMIGLDQDMMQKNLTCKSLKDAQKNMEWFSISFVISVILFLILGVMLYIFAERNGIAIPEKSDDLYPILALSHLGVATGILFLLGITAAAYSSADSALTSLTTSFCFDFLSIDRIDSEERRIKIRNRVHIGFSLILIIVITLFDTINSRAIVDAIFTVAGYTYGPLLGLFAFGIFSKRVVKDRAVPYITILAPILSWVVAHYSPILLDGYKIGYELLLINGGFTALGLLIFSSPKKR